MCVCEEEKGIYSIHRFVSKPKHSVSSIETINNLCERPVNALSLYKTNQKMFHRYIFCISVIHFIKKQFNTQEDGDVKCFFIQRKNNIYNIWSFVLTFKIEIINFWIVYRVYRNQWVNFKLRINIMLLMWTKFAFLCVWNTVENIMLRIFFMAFYLCTNIYICRTGKCCQILCTI